MSDTDAELERSQTGALEPASAIYTPSSLDAGRACDYHTSGNKRYRTRSQ